MWQILIGVVMAIVGVVGIWYSIKRSAATAQDRDAALQEKQVAEGRAKSLNDKLLADEEAQRKVESDATAKLTAATAATWLRESGKRP